MNLKQTFHMKKILFSAGLALMLVSCAEDGVGGRIDRRSESRYRDEREAYQRWSRHPRLHP